MLRSILCKGEYARIEFIRQELLHKLKVLTAHCEEVERQRGEEAEKCRLIAVLLFILV